MTTWNDSSGFAANDPVTRYQYLLRTASPDQIEQAHAEAFAAMTPAERQTVLASLARAGQTPADASASSLARSATRLEMQQPGTLQRLFGAQQTTDGSLLTSIAAGVAGATIFSALTGGDGIGGRPGLLARLFGLGRRPHGMGGMWGPMMGYGGRRPPRGGFGGPGGFGGFGGPGGFGGRGGPGGFGGRGGPGGPGGF